MKKKVLANTPPFKNFPSPNAKEDFLTLLLEINNAHFWAKHIDYRLGNIECDFINETKNLSNECYELNKFMRMPHTRRCLSKHHSQMLTNIEKIKEIENPAKHEDYRNAIDAISKILVEMRSHTHTDLIKLMRNL